MAAPKHPNTAPAAAARRRIGDAAAAERLRAAGWLVLPPGQVTLLQEKLGERIAGQLSPPDDIQGGP